MVIEVHKELAGQDGRAADRRDVRIPVKVRRPGENWFRSQLTDLSARGFRLQTFMKVSRGDSLWIMLPGFEGRRALVQWSRGPEAGCHFERPLHPAILDHIVKISQQPR